MKRFGVEYFQRFPKPVQGKITYKLMIWNRIFWQHIDGETRTAEIVMEWMPSIVSFAMLGMILGLLKKGEKLNEQ